jgi:hypothetical protein
MVIWAPVQSGRGSGDLNYIPIHWSVIQLIRATATEAINQR